MKSKDSHPMIIWVTSEQIVTGNDSSMSPAMLAPGQTVTYRLDDDACIDYEYKESADEAITLMSGPTSMMPNVHIDRHDAQLTVKIRNVDHCPSNDQPWQGKATLFFNKKRNSTAHNPNPSGLDPLISNTGPSTTNWKPPL